MCNRLYKVLSAEGEAYVLNNILAMRTLKTMEELRAYLNGWEIEVKSTEPPSEDADEEAA